MKVKFNSRANREARSIAEYYEFEVGAKPSNEFLDEFEKTIDRIKLGLELFRRLPLTSIGPF